MISTPAPPPTATPSTLRLGGATPICTMLSVMFMLGETEGVNVGVADSEPVEEGEGCREADVDALTLAVGDCVGVLVRLADWVIVAVPVLLVEGVLVCVLLDVDVCGGRGGQGSGRQARNGRWVTRRGRVGVE